MSIDHCCICMQSYTPVKRAPLAICQSKHTLCYQCFLKIYTSGDCPFCRQPIKNQFIKYDEQLFKSLGFKVDNLKIMEKGLILREDLIQTDQQTFNQYLNTMKDLTQSYKKQCTERHQAKIKIAKEFLYKDFDKYSELVKQRDRQEIQRNKPAKKAQVEPQKRCEWHDHLIGGSTPLPLLLLYIVIVILSLAVFYIRYERLLGEPPSIQSCKKIAAMMNPHTPYLQKL